MKKIIIILSILILVVFGLFAQSEIERNTWLLPRACVNGESTMIDLTNTIAFGAVGGASVPSATFTTVNDNNAQVFRLRSTLEQNTTIEIQPGTSGWNFIHEHNSSAKIPFQLNGFRYYWEVNSENGYDNTGTIAEGISGGPISDEDTTPYTFTLPASTSSAYGWGLLEPQISTYYEEEVVLELEDASGDLETGYYYADFNVFYQDVNGSTITQYIKIKGYVNVSSDEIFDPFSFSLTTTTDTYNLDLTDTDSYNNVVELNFALSTTETLGSDPSGAAYDDKYVVYISPSSNPTALVGTYTLVGEESPYLFIKRGSENQTRTETNTISYNIFKNSSAGTFDSVSDNGITFTIPVDYSFEKTTAGTMWSGGDDQYVENWILNETPVYIKVNPPNDAGVMQEAGAYYSNIYFFVYTNDST